MGALKTGGQGSVYKGRRIGEIITAIKILPTPIYSESGDDKNFVSFQNEVEKLKKVNEDANPNVVTIVRNTDLRVPVSFLNAAILLRNSVSYFLSNNLIKKRVINNLRTL